MSRFPWKEDNASSSLAGQTSFNAPLSKLVKEPVLETGISQFESEMAHQFGSVSRLATAAVLKTVEAQALGSSTLPRFRQFWRVARVVMGQLAKL